MMDTIAVGRPNYYRVANTEQLSAKIHVGDARHEVYFKTNDGPIDKGPEPFLALGLLPAMRLGQRVHVSESISPLLLSNLRVLQARFAEADSRLRVIEVVAGASNPMPRPSNPRVGAFFSGGVDSFFLLLELKQEITDLVFVHGFDIDIRSEEVHRAALEMARSVARDMGKRLIHVETNLRHFGDRYVDWGDHLHGPALAAVAICCPLRSSAC